jgi:hypothetical protein
VTDRDHAIHEGGHAVAATVLGISIRRVALLPEGGGICELDPLPADGSEVRRALFVLMAGAAAQAVKPAPDEPLTRWRL